MLPSKTPFAPRSEVLHWFALSFAIACLMLVGVWISGTFLPEDPSEGASSLLLGDYSLGHHMTQAEEFKRVFGRNLLVLLLHFFCCMIGAIISREHKPLTGRWKKFAPLHQELPKWVADLSLAYAFTITLASIAIQTTGLGFVMADMSAYSGLPPWEMTLLILPHAPLELTAVFLPLALFIIQARRDDLRPLGTWVWQSFFIALPLIALAASIEVSVTPYLFTKAIDANGGLPMHQFQLEF